MILDRAEAAFWAAYLRNRNVDAGTADDGAVPVAGGYAIFVKDSSHQLAHAVGSTRALREDDLAVLAEFYRRRGRPARIEVRDDVFERDRPLLDAAGYAPAMSLALLESEDLGSAVPPGVTVRLTSDRSGWSRLVARAFADEAIVEGPALQRSVEIAAAAAHGLFVAEVDGVPAGGGAVAVLPGEVAYLFCAAVAPAFRGRGVHRALVRARAAFGGSRGARRSALKTISGGAAERSALAQGFTRTALLRRLAATDG